MFGPTWTDHLLALGTECSGAIAGVVTVIALSVLITKKLFPGGPDLAMHTERDVEFAACHWAISKDGVAGPCGDPLEARSLLSGGGPA